MKKTLQVILAVLEIVTYTLGIVVWTKNLINLTHSDENESTLMRRNASKKPVCTHRGVNRFFVHVTASGRKKTDMMRKT